MMIKTAAAKPSWHLVANEMEGRYHLAMDIGSIPSYQASRDSGSIPFLGVWPPVFVGITVCREARPVSFDGASDVAFL